MTEQPDFDAKIKEAVDGMRLDETALQASAQASAIINESYLKTVLSLGIEILSKIDTSRTRKEIGEYYVNMFRGHLAETIGQKARNS